MRIRIIDHGTVWRFTALDDEACEFLHSVGAESWQFLGRNTLCMDHRVAGQFCAQAAAEGVQFEVLQ